MLMSSQDAILLVIDMQDNLLDAIYDYRKIVDNCCWLIRLAKMLEVPLLLTEHYPKGLGGTDAAIRACLPEQTAILEKIHFSCGQSPSVKNALVAHKRNQIILAGIEAHVCVLQSAFDFLQQFNQVYVVTDAIGSRKQQDRDMAITRLQHHRVQCVTKEMVFYEWFKQADTELFKTLNRELIKT